MAAGRGLPGRWWTVGCACWLLAACASTPSRRTPAADTIPARDAPYDLDSEGAVPPPPFVEPQPASAGMASATRATVPRWQPGFRVQVFACASRDDAEAVRRQVGARVTAPTYVEYEAPYYRVRVGDCRTEAECRGLEAELRRAGYASAWTAATHVLSP